MKKSYKIEVDCANCANLIENAARKVSGVKTLTISFMTQKMKIEYEDDVQPEEVLKEIIRVAKRIEPDFKVL